MNTIPFNSDWTEACSASKRHKLNPNLPASASNRWILVTDGHGGKVSKRLTPLRLAKPQATNLAFAFTARPNSFAHINPLGYDYVRSSFLFFPHRFKRPRCCKSGELLALRRHPHAPVRSRMSLRVRFWRLQVSSQNYRHFGVAVRLRSGGEITYHFLVGIQHRKRP